MARESSLTRVVVLIRLIPASAEKERKAIQITLPDGNVKEGTSWETSPMSVALSISKGLAEKMVVAKVIK